MESKADYHVVVRYPDGRLSLCHAGYKTSQELYQFLYDWWVERDLSDPNGHPWLIVQPDDRNTANWVQLVGEWLSHAHWLDRKRRRESA